MASTIISQFDIPFNANYLLDARFSDEYLYQQMRMQLKTIKWVKFLQ